MAINQNHTFEDLDGVKCAIVEKKVSPERMAFLKELLELNGYKVICVPSAPARPAAEGEDKSSVQEELQLYTVGVSDVRFNTINAIYGRLLHTREGRVVTMNYWQQKEKISDDTVPYYEH